MSNTELKTLRELNVINDEVFKLNTSGKKEEAVLKATNALQIAKMELGEWHPYLNILYDILNYVKNDSRMFGKKQKVNTNKKNIPADEASSLTNPILITEIEIELERATDAYGINYPYVKILRRNLVFLRTKKGNRNFARLKRYMRYLFGKGSIIKITVFFIFFGLFFFYLNIVASFIIEYKLENKTFELTENVFQYNDPFGDYSYELRDKALINAPLILQNPELPRGCEVTSLAMLLQYADVSVDKLTLASQIEKDTSPYKVVDDKIHFGDPNIGFVGDMYSVRNPGLGVYHGPIYDLANEYLPGQVIDLSGRPFNDLLYFLNNDIPVWVITNTEFKKLDSSYFETWVIDGGTIDVTYKQHSVLLTGYDSKYVYFNDPLRKGKNQKATLKSFEAAWYQMGQQAISYVPKEKNLFEILPIE